MLSISLCRKALSPIIIINIFAIIFSSCARFVGEVGALLGSFIVVLFGLQFKSVIVQNWLCCTCVCRNDRYTGYCPSDLCRIQSIPQGAVAKKIIFSPIVLPSDLVLCRTHPINPTNSSQHIIVKTKWVLQWEDTDKGPVSVFDWLVSLHRHKSPSL